MTNGVVVQVVLLLVSGAILMCGLILYKRRKAPPEPARKVPTVRPVAHKRVEAEPQLPRPIRVQTESGSAPVSSAVNQSPAISAVKPMGTIDVGSALTIQEDRNERILAGISENIKKSLQMRPVPQHSPIPHTESKPRNTEYVRVKKEIITPHGHIRFSILKDWMSINMLAVFRRASLEWKTPDDLIAFIPAYLEPEADVLNGQVLLVGTPGHNQKLAVPIGSLDAASGLGQCFDFVNDARAAVNTPAVVEVSGGDFEVVSKGVITQRHTEVELLADRSTEEWQKRYSAALRRIESPIAADAT